MVGQPGDYFLQILVGTSNALSIGGAQSQAIFHLKFFLTDVCAFKVPSKYLSPWLLVRRDRHSELMLVVRPPIGTRVVYGQIGLSLYVRRGALCAPTSKYRSMTLKGLSGRFRGTQGTLRGVFNPHISRCATGMVLCFAKLLSLASHGGRIASGIKH